MKANDQQPGFSGLRLPSPPGGLIGRLLTIVAGALLLVVAFMFSLLALAVVAVGGLLLFGYLKWKTRHLSRFLHEQMQQQAGRQEQQQDGQVIEGEVIRDAEHVVNPEAATSDQRLQGFPTRYDNPGNTSGHR